MANLDLFRLALEDMYQCGLISSPMALDSRVWAGTPTMGGWCDVAYELACRLPGQLWPGNHGVTWVCGRGGPHGMIIDHASIHQLRDAQEALAGIGLRVEVPWSRGRLCRAALSWVADPDTIPTGTDHIMEGVSHAWFHCTPGTYDSLNAYDVRSFYYSLSRYAPGPRVWCTKESEVVWGGHTDHEKGRWRDLLSVVGNDKLLRNSLVGCAMGSKHARPVYMRGPGKPTYEDGNPKPFFDPTAGAHRRHLTLSGTPWRALGLLIARSAYELCGIASYETGSVYSATDSVFTTGNSPQIWSEYGFETELKASGQAEVYCRGVWRVGNLATPTYLSGARDTIETPPSELPRRMVHQKWLKSVCPGKLPL